MKSMNCIAIKKDGLVCKNKAKYGNYCGIHKKKLPNEIPNNKKNHFCILNSKNLCIKSKNNKNDSVHCRYNEKKQIDAPRIKKRLSKSIKP
jgi:hypothetical protein